MGTVFDDPNRESVGLEPIWTGAGVEVEPTEGKDKPAKKSAAKKSGDEDDDE